MKRQTDNFFIPNNIVDQQIFDLRKTIDECINSKSFNLYCNGRLEVVEMRRWRAKRRRKNDKWYEKDMRENETYVMRKNYDNDDERDEQEDKQKHVAFKSKIGQEDDPAVKFLYKIHITHET